MTPKKIRTSVLRKIDERVSETGLKTHFGISEIDEMVEERYYFFMASILSRRPDLYARITDGVSYPHLVMTAGSQLVSLPADYGGVALSVELIIGGKVVFSPLEYIPYAALLRKNNTLIGQPEAFCFMGNNLFLWPAPPDSGLVRLTYNYIPVFPASEDSDIIFPSGYEIVIPYQVVMDCAVKAGMSDGSKAVVKSELAEAKSALNRFLASERQSYNASMRFRGSSG